MKVQLYTARTQLVRLFLRTWYIIPLVHFSIILNTLAIATISNYHEKELLFTLYSLAVKSTEILRSSLCQIK